VKTMICFHLQPIQLWKSPPTQERRQRETDELSTCRSGFR